MRICKYLIFNRAFPVKLSLLCSTVFVLLLSAPQTSFTDTETLERIAKAEREINYIGVRLMTFISPRGTKTFEELVIHKSPDNFYAKELSEVGAPKQLENSQGDKDHRDNRRRGRGENHRNDRERQIRWQQVKYQFSEKKVQLIAQNYNLEKAPSTETIGNYETDILTITPKFVNRPTKRIFFARENGAILRVEVLDAQSVLRSMSVYTRISFDPETVERKWTIFGKEIKLEPQRSTVISLAEAEKVLETKPIQPAYLPPGFQLQNVRNVKGRRNTIQLIYADGLLGFSIFETTDPRARRGSERRRGSDVIEIEGTHVHKHQRGPTYAFNWSSENIHFFLFGAMPPTEMEQVVQSIIQKTNEK